MRLGLFTMPLHPLHRDPAVTLQEDREAIILADRFGYHDAFVGDFGELVYAGMDWVNPQLARRSMELMATEVMPRVNQAIGAAAKPPPRMAVTREP